MGLQLTACKNRGGESGNTLKESDVAEVIPEFFQVIREVSEVRIEQMGQNSVLKVNAAMRPEEFNGLVKGIRTAALAGSMPFKFTHRMDFRYPEGGIFADYDMNTNCLYFKDLGSLEQGGPIVWPAAGFAKAMEGCASFWEGFPEE